MRSFLVVTTALAALFCSSCFGTADVADNFTWVDDLAEEQLQPSPYKIRGGDKLQVTVFKQESLSGEVLVREDGNVTVPLVGDVVVLGKTPPLASDEIALRLSATGFIDKPSVSVAVLETRQPSFAVVGEVRQPGSFELQPGTTVLDAVALAGGLSEFAEKERIFVIRKGRGGPAETTTPPPPPTTPATPPEAPAEGAAPEAPAAPEVAAAPPPSNRVRFSWARLSRSDGKGLRFHVEDGDVIVVE
ncbi:MAG: polysaccharide biosynthesis/export family protein [Deltaproteobacteria bacterium]|nr:polysaccharide biosynthesis/export family protein [Deltaproteobacteria bacterium]